MRTFFLLILCLLTLQALAQNTITIPAVHSHIQTDAEGKLYVEFEGQRYYEAPRGKGYTLTAMQGNPVGTEKGIAFDFADSTLEGTLYYGFIPYTDAKHALPVYFRVPASISKGKASISIIPGMRGRYDMVGWEAAGYGTLGYRVVNHKGEMLYDGKVTFEGTGPFTVAPSLVEGPFIDQVTPSSAIVSFSTLQATQATVTANGKSYDSQGIQHQVALTGLAPNTTYDYTLAIGPITYPFQFKTAPQPGSRQPFVFAYASDSRNGQGGGERNLYGANYYIVKRIMALAHQQGTAFVQFSGDLINGYLTSPGEMDLQYANWKRAVEPFAHDMPIYEAMGNHEALMRTFRKEGERKVFWVDRFPYATESGEAVFARNFVNPVMGPPSEDDASYDPNPGKPDDFPPYAETVFSYTHDNVAVVVLNSDYFYAPTGSSLNHSSGNPHAYILDQQMAWLKNEVAQLEGNPAIDHVFVTLHTPFFPNGGHVSDDMWYRGNNSMRPYVAGKVLPFGIIERRDQLLDIVVNQSSKVRALLTGDEHNFCYTQLGPETELYTEDWTLPRLTLNRTIYQVNNGAAGAPYYAQEQTPWTPFTEGFTTQNALVFFYVDGPALRMVVRNPDTLEEFDSLVFIEK